MTPNPDVFHDHLDTCKQCRDQPFNLCAEGAVLLQTAAVGLSPTGRAPSEPEFQRIPIRTELGKVIRAAAPRPGEIFMQMNYASLEQRIYAEFGGEHDKHDTKKPSCMFCDAGIPKREVTYYRPDPTKDEVVIVKGPLKPPK